MQDYHYNLVLFREIKRFIIYRDQLGTFAVFSNLFGNILIFMPFGYFLTMAGKSRSFFQDIVLQYGAESLCGSTAAFDESRQF